MSESRLTRRDTFKLIAAASAAGAMRPPELSAQNLPVAPTAQTDPAARKPTLTDPDFAHRDALWEKPLVDDELATLTILCDLIIPGDDLAPPPSKLELADFLNEWVGAPYEINRADLEIIRGGLAWLNTHCDGLHGKPFAELDGAGQRAVLDSICDPEKTAPEVAFGAVFFKKLRMLTLGGYYSHSATWKSLGYVGNTPIAGPYPGPPPEVLAILGLEGE